MPRRTSTRTVTSSATPQAPATPQQLETPYDSNIHYLRRHWKWAAFSQFFFTFSPLLAMPNVSLTDVENDLVHSTDRVLSRIMQRLLVTLTQDRKITTDTWQNALRRQYQRRDPQASPIGLVTRFQHFTAESSQASTPPPAVPSEAAFDGPERGDHSLERRQSTSSPSPDNAHRAASSAGNSENIPVTKVEEEDNSETLEAPGKQPDWLDLSMFVKLESLHTLAEWQFQNPNRVRQQMKTDDEQATWRIEPIGYDAKRNTYWLIGGDRLWIQREPPRPNLKRKQKPGGNGRNVTKVPTQSLTTKRLRIDSNPVALARSPVIRITRGRTQSQQSPGSREGRAAKTRANQRLDAQARDLAEFRRQMVTPTRAASIAPHKPTGIRVSARLRGTVVDSDEWQEVPDEWLAVSDTHKAPAKDSPSDSLPANRKRKKTGLESDNSSISELTELSEGDDGVGTERDLDRKATVDMEETDPASKDQDTGLEDEGEDQLDDAKSLDPPVTPSPPDDFVEWETICVTIEEWESIGQMFEKATHYAEKALHKVLSQSIVPMATAELREIEKKRRMEEAVVHRKRSSRIAIKETEKEEERAIMRKRAEEQEKMSRARRLEARQQKEQAERLRRENAREQRRKERELREQQSAEMQEAESKHDSSVDNKEDFSSSLLQGKASVTMSIVPMNGTGSGSRSPVENWELDCEVCGSKGINQDDGVSLLCCGMCGKWQHIVCHDKQDSMAGRPKRNWDAEDFICRQCRLTNPKSSSSSSSLDFISLGVNNRKAQASSSPAYYAQPSNHPRDHPNNSYYQDSQSNAKYSRDHPDFQATVPPSPHSYTPQASSAGVTFAHYQPQQGGFSTSRPTYTLQDVSSPQHTRYSITPHPVSATGITPYPPAFHTQAMTHSSAHVHEQWVPSSYPRNTNSYPTNGGQSLHSQGGQPYYNGHVHASYSHTRGTTSPTALGRYAGLQHVPSYQHNNSGRLQD